MGALLVRILGVVGAAILSVMMFGSGVASADLVGLTYDEAAEWISSRNGTPVVGTVSGDQLDTGDCVVVSWQTSKFLNSSGDNDRAKDFLLNLNCNNLVASPGNPGNSVMTPQGAQAKKEQQAATKINNNPTWCETTDEAMEYCEKICTRTGLCEV